MFLFLKVVFCLLWFLSVDDAKLERNRKIFFQDYFKCFKFYPNMLMECIFTVTISHTDR